MRWITWERLRSHHALFWAASIAVCAIGYADVVFANKTFVAVGYVPGTYGLHPFAAGYTGRPAPQYPELDAGAEAWFVHPLAYHERRAISARVGILSLGISVFRLCSDPRSAGRSILALGSLNRARRARRTCC